MPLTETSIRSLKSGPKVRRVADERGLYLELSLSGAKLWRFKYRFEGKEKRLSFGMYPDVSLKQARERREEARMTLARGIDPGLQKKALKAAAANRAANSFEVVAREFHSKQAGTWSKAHSSRWLGRMTRDIFPFLGSSPIENISAPDLLAVLRKVEPRALETAHRLRFQCGQVFQYGVATGRCTRNISRDLAGALQPARPKHFAATTEPNDFAPILRLIHAYRGTAVVSAALRIAPLVFVRPGELRQAKKGEIDLETAEWRFVSSKTQKEHLVPLSRQVVEILRELDPVTEGSDYVFPGARSSKRPMSDNAILAAMRSMEIPNDVMTGHGFRAVARTILDEVLGFRADIIEHQLAHEVKDPNGRAYNRTSFLPERRRMMQAWADYCDELRTRVIAFPKRA